MEGKDPRKPTSADEQGKVKTSQNESGLSFEAEPTGLGQDPAVTEGGHPEPSRDSSRPDYTPGPRVKARSPFALTPVSKVLLVVLVALVMLAMLAVWVL